METPMSASTRTRIHQQLDVAILARTPGAKIAAIKAYRKQTGAGLRESKAAVEQF